jgi:hypothetical protein
VFWRVLGELVEYKRVQLDESYGDKGKPVIGKPLHVHCRTGAAGNTDLYQISTQLALAEVNKLLREQGRPELKVTVSALLSQLRSDGKLFDDDGKVLVTNEKENVTTQVRIGGEQKRAFITSKALLIGSRQAGVDPGFSGGEGNNAIAGVIRG